ncbi:MAG: hypothetical protein AAFO07_16935 [Bacteroidota bacterium]
MNSFSSASLLLFFCLFVNTVFAQQKQTFDCTIDGTSEKGEFQYDFRFITKEEPDLEESFDGVLQIELSEIKTIYVRTSVRKVNASRVSLSSHQAKLKEKKGVWYQFEMNQFDYGNNKVNVELELDNMFCTTFQLNFELKNPRALVNDETGTTTTAIPTPEVDTINSLPNVEVSHLERRQTLEEQYELKNCAELEEDELCDILKINIAKLSELSYEWQAETDSTVEMLFFNIVDSIQFKLNAGEIALDSLILEPYDEYDFAYRITFLKDDTDHYFRICDSTKIEDFQCSEEISIPARKIPEQVAIEEIDTLEEAVTEEAVEEMTQEETSILPYLLGGGSVMALLIVFLGMRSRSKRKKKKLALSKSNPLEVPQPIVPEPAPAVIPPAVATEQKTKIKLSKKDSVEKLNLDSLISKGAYMAISIDEMWEDTSLSRIYISKAAIRELNTFLRNENTDKIEETNGDIPEIGGMLLGAVKEENGIYQASIDRFIPIRSKEDNIYELKFDEQAMVTVLSDFMEQNPEYSVVGWFHTHPGHKLFLSKPDLKVQHGHFREPYHFAMEIDSLTTALDTAFFTWKKDLKNMNNNLTFDKSWLSWVEIEKFV